MCVRVCTCMHVCACVYVHACVYVLHLFTVLLKGDKNRNQIFHSSKLESYSCLLLQPTLLDFPCKIMTLCTPTIYWQIKKSHWNTSKLYYPNLNYSSIHLVQLTCVTLNVRSITGHLTTVSWKYTMSTSIIIINKFWVKLHIS